MGDNQDVRYHRQYVATDYSRESLNIWTKSIEQIDLYSKILPAIAFTPAENETLASIKTEINTLTEEKCDMFVLGKENFDNYDAFIAQLKKSKVDDAIALIQQHMIGISRTRTVKALFDGKLKPERRSAIRR